MIKKVRSCILAAIWLGAVLFLVTSSALPVRADTLQDPVTFQVTTTADGASVGPYTDFEAEGGTRYLFLPAYVDTENLTINYSGNIRAVSDGHLDTIKHTISGNLSGLIATSGNGRDIPLIIMQSRIPSLEITLPDTTLDDVHADKDRVVTNASAVLIDPKDPNNNFESAGSCEFKGRGNSSWEVYDKKGYQLRLGEPRMVLGMDRAKTWILLANASDPTLLRNKVVYDAAKQVNFSFAPEGEFVDLWVNGEYRGNYLLTEKVQIGPNRLNLVSGHGIIAEFDNAFYNNEIFFAGYLGNYFTLKDSAAPNGLADFLEFQEAIDTLDYMLDVKSDWEKIAARIDAESFARAFLINEYFANCESAVTSFFWYRDGNEDVLHAGPIWDFDTCMRDGVEDPAKYYVYQNAYYHRFLAYPEFQQLVTEMYANEIEPACASSANDMYTLRDRISSSIDMNFTRWDVLGGTDAKGHESFPSYELNFSDQRRWLQERAQSFRIEGIIGEIVPYTFSINVSEDGRYADLYLASSKRAVSAAEFAVWSEAGGAGSVTWVRADRDDADTASADQAVKKWHARFDLTTARYLGTYHVQAAVNGQRATPVGEGTFFVTSLPEAPYVYTYEGIDFSPVFDPLYYAMRYPIVRKQCGYDGEKLFTHFIQTGIRAGYAGNEDFDVLWYKENNEDLAAIYKDSYISYYEHYLIKGMAEGRPGRP